MEHHEANRNSQEGFAATGEFGSRTALRRMDGSAGCAQLADRIRELCASVVASEVQYPQILAELRCALHEHNRMLRFLAARKLVLARSPGGVTAFAPQTAKR